MHRILVSRKGIALTVRQPSVANFRAIASPKPAVAPVTSAVLVLMLAIVSPGSKIKFEIPSYPSTSSEYLKELMGAQIQFCSYTGRCGCRLRIPMLTETIL